jgi:hypothetical protein
VSQKYWPPLVVLVVGLFMLVAGIGPLLLPIVVVVLGIGLFVMANQRR